MQKFVLVLSILITLASCKEEGPLSAQEIIDRAIEVAGGERFMNSTIDFDFRSRHYKALRDNGIFQLEREFMDSLDVVRDIYNNSEYKRLVNDVPVHVPDTMAVKYTNSVNSVHYFMVLPHGLNDTAVIKTYIDEVEIKAGRITKLRSRLNKRVEAKIMKTFLCTGSIPKPIRWTSWHILLTIRIAVSIFALGRAIMSALLTGYALWITITTNLKTWMWIYLLLTLCLRIMS